MPHFPTFGKNYERHFAGSDIFEKIFERISLKAINCGFVDASAVFIDATHTKASANSKNYTTELINIEANHYQQELVEEIKYFIYYIKEPINYQF